MCSKTYLNADGFLGGLTLNQENTKLRPEYEDILRFYGFDLSVPEEGPDEPTPEPEMSTMTDQPVTEMVTSAPGEAATQTTTSKAMQGPETTGEAGISTTPQIELIDTTLSTVDMQDRLTQSTPDSIASIDVTNSATPSTLSTTSSSEVSSSGAPVTASAASGEPLTTTAATVQLTTMVSSTVQSPSIDGRTITSTSSTLPSTSPASPTLDSSATSLSMDRGSESTTPPSQSATPSTSTTAETTTDMSITAAAFATVTEASSSTISNSTQANEMTIVSTNGPPADENTVSTDSSNNQTAPREMGSTDLPATTAATGEIELNEQSTIAASSTTNDTMTRRKRSLRGSRGFFSSYPGSPLCYLFVIDRRDFD